MRPTLWPGWGRPIRSTGEEPVSRSVDRCIHRTPAALFVSRDEFRPRRRYVLTSSPEHPERTGHEGDPMSNSRAADEAAIQAVLAASYEAWAAGDADGMV